MFQVANGGLEDAFNESAESFSISPFPLELYGAEAAAKDPQTLLIELDLFNGGADQGTSLHRELFKSYTEDTQISHPLSK